MSENFRVVAGVLLLCVVAVGISYLTTERPFSFSLIDRECEDAQQQYYDARDGLGASKNKYPAEQERARSDAQDHADVCAQNRMAKAAEVGFWLLLFSLLFAGAAAVASWLTLRTMRDTAKRELRAYISVNPTILFNYGAVQPIRIECIARNHGQTPAFDINYVVEIDVLPLPLPNGFAFPEPTREVRHNSVVFPNSEMSVWFNREAALTPQQIATISAGTHNLYLWGRSNYIDAFGDARTVRIRCSLDLATFLHHMNEVGAGRPSPGWRWVYGDQHNQAD